MAAMSNPLLIPEIVGLVIDNIQLARDLLSCACVNSIWNVAALKKLYKGTLNDMQFRTPDIGSLNSLLVASRVRFTRNMSFVKHLLLSPEIPTVDDAADPQTRLACFEKCRAMRRRQYAELLLRPRGRGLTSLTIPFELVDQDWSLICDLLPTPTVQYLAIDGFYCGLLTARSWHDQFSNLRAVTIYKSDSHQDLDGFCKLVSCCTDLQFFHLEEGRGTFREDQTDTAEPTTNLLLCLGQHQNLKALALMTPRCWPSLRSVLATLPKTEQQEPWPSLKALYLRNWDPDWWQQLPNFKELQILSLRPASEVAAINRTAIDEIAKCRKLRVIEVEFDELDDVEALLRIAHGCPLLRKLSVYFRRSGEMSEDLFLGLLRALPCLEVLELSWPASMDGATLQKLAHHCPRLTVLELPQTELRLSMRLMRNLHSLPHLEVMRVKGICFENPRRLMQHGKIQSIATEWRRIFPKLRDMPCRADFWSLYRMEDNFSEGSEDTSSVSANEDTSLTEPRHEPNDYKSDCCNLRTKLWKVLGYGGDRDSYDRVPYMWQTSLEIETVGWPVVPLEAFFEPDTHSSTIR